MSLDQSAKRIIKCLKDHGYEAYYVGGCVRDRLLGITSSDIDIATSAPSRIVQSLFPKTIPVGIKFGIIVVVDEGHNFEVATFRKDLDYIDGRHPEHVEHSTIEEDVKRRDFTINGLYFDPLEDKLIDLIHGKKDLNDKLIKAIGDPKKRFEEDHLRMIRACRYAACLNFSIEPATKEAIRQMAPICHEGVSIERIIQELDKMHTKGFLSQGLFLLDELLLLKAIFPTLSYQDENTLKKRFLQISELSKNTPLVFALCILFDLKNEKEVEHLCKQFKLSNEALKMGSSFVEFKKHLTLTNIKMATLLSLPYSQDLISSQSTYEKNKEEFLHLIHMKKQELKPVIERLIHKDPIITASDLEKLNVKKGPVYKKLLDDAMSYFANHPSMTKEQVLEHICLFIPKE